METKNKKMIKLIGLCKGVCDATFTGIASQKLIDEAKRGDTKAKIGVGALLVNCGIDLALMVMGSVDGHKTIKANKVE